MREEQEPHKDTLELVAAVGAIVILVACAIADVPRLGRTARAAQDVKDRELDRQPFTELQAAMHQLQARNSATDTDLVKIARLLENTRSELAGLKEGHNALNTQVATTTAKLQQLEAAVQQTNERIANSGDSAVVQKIATERDEALARSKQSNEQVRQLTLQLQKAGVYP